MGHLISELDSAAAVGSMVVAVEPDSGHRSVNPNRNCYERMQLPGSEG